MKFTWRWLCEHLDNPASLEKVTETLSMIGLEVESVDNKAETLAPFVIAKVIETKPHPNADSLQLCQVDTGSGKPIEVVCGAPNAKKDMIGVFAPVGSYVPGIDLTLSAAKIRGVVSQGMLCSERELMLSDEHEGIIELPQDAPIGKGFASWAGLDDQVIEVGITPNRADCLGVRGIARDLAAAGCGKLKPLKKVAIASKGKSKVNWKIDLKGKEHLAPRVAGRSFSNLRNGDSPDWLKQRLTAIGQRPISALVDITNYIMIDLGRPLHAYDMDKIKGDTLTIRLAKEGEKVEALNEKTYTLSSGMLIIADAIGADDLAGIMGGQRSGISDSTSNMFLEMAIFDPICVATTGRKLNIHSDARFRFERGLDVTSPDWAMDYVSAMVLDICGGEASETTHAGKGVNWQRKIPHRPERVKELSGVEVAAKKQAEILTDLGFEVKKSKADLWEVSPPPWRGDIDGSADLVEEIIRIYGFDSIPTTPMNRDWVVAKPAVSAIQKRPYVLKQLLAGRGMVEAVTFSFLDEKLAKRFGGGSEALELVNPISTELASMRPSLLPNLLGALSRNAARGEGDASLFEIAPVFWGAEPDEQRLVVGGVRHGMTSGREWNKSERSVDWADAKADALAVLGALGVNLGGVQTSLGAPDYYHPGRSGALIQGKAVLGRFGALHPQILDEFDLRGSCVAFEIVLDDIPLPKVRSSARPMVELSPFQSVQRDFAFIVENKISAEQLLRAIKGAGKPLISDASIFDIYEGEGIKEGHKSLAVAVTLQPTESTLREEEIETISNAIIEAVAKHCGGTLRR